MIVIALCIAIAFKSQLVAHSTVPITPVVSTTTPTSKVSGYSLAEILKHKTAQSCWTTIQGNVYDLTAWITQHPGGEEAILGLCGRDGTQDFMDQHGGQGKPERELAKYAIGPLI